MRMNLEERCVPVSGVALPVAAGVSTNVVPSGPEPTITPEITPLPPVPTPRGRAVVS